MITSYVGGVGGGGGGGGGGSILLLIASVQLSSVQMKPWLLPTLSI